MPEFLPVPARAKDLAQEPSFGQWTVLGISRFEFTGKKHNRVIVWRCRCSCGNEGDVRAADLCSGQSTRCRRCGLQSAAVAFQAHVANIPMPTVRSCSDCKRVFPLTAEFFPRRLYQDRYRVPLGYRCKTCHNAYSGLRNKAKRERDRLTVITHYSNGLLCCSCCGVADYEFLTLDHANDDGKKHREETQGRIFVDLIRRGFPEGIAVLCTNCNFGRELCGGTCPHQGGTPNRLRNTENYSTAKSAHESGRIRNLRMELLIAYSSDPPRCSCCGENTLAFLTIDHISGGGRKERLSDPGRIRRLKKEGFPPGFRVLCISCNHCLGNRGYCPHQQIRAGSIIAPPALI